MKYLVEIDGEIFHASDARRVALFLCGRDTAKATVYRECELNEKEVTDIERALKEGESISKNA